MAADMTDYMIDANKALERNRYRRALKLYEQEISARRDNLLARDRAARCLLNLKRPRESLAMCDETLRLDPNYALAHARRAQAYYVLKEASRSNEDMAIAYAMAPTDPEILGAYGSLLLFQKQFDEARNFLDRALQADPGKYFYYQKLAAVAFGQRDKPKMVLYTREMYRMQRTPMNLLWLAVAHVCDPRLGVVLAISLMVLLWVAASLHAWWVWAAACSFALFLFALAFYLRSR